MHAFTTCMQCQVESGVPNFLSIGKARIPEVGYIKVECDQGHHSYLVLQQAPHEILSELAVVAMCDEYYREAVLSFSAALERLYEHFIRVVCKSRGVSSVAFSKGWKVLKNSSERQLGAFSALYLSETLQPFQGLSHKQIELRNNVAHKGRILTREEALAYGQAVGECARSLQICLKAERYEAAARSLIFERLKERARTAEEAGLPHAVLSLVTPFAEGSEGSFDLEKLLAQRAAMPDMDQAIMEARAYAALIGQ